MEKIIKREKYLSKIRPFYNDNVIKVITGIRRCGKSMILQLIIDELLSKRISQKLIIKLNFDDMDNDYLCNSRALYEYVKSKINCKKKYYLFLDEIQNVDSFEKAIESIYTKFNISIFITGSNSKLLSSEIATLLTGRTIEFNILPFSYDEYISYCKINKIHYDIENSFYNYLKWGGFPKTISQNDEYSKNLYLKNLFNSIIQKDILYRHKITNKNIFCKLSEYMIINTGKLLSIKNIKNYINTNNNLPLTERTLYNYINYLANCYIINPINKYNSNGKKILLKTDKYYAIDVGLSYMLTNKIDFDDCFLLENIIYNELLSRGYEVYVGKTYKGEIDFIATTNNKKYFIQVCYLLANKDIIEREFGAFAPIKDASPKYVFSLDKIDFSRNGIIHINIIDFLLNKVSL